MTGTLVDIAAIRSVAGASTPIARRVALPGLRLEGAAVEAVPDVDVEVAAHVVDDEIVVAGHIRTEWSGTCRRCLEAIAEPLEVAVHESFTDPPIEGESYALGDETIDIADMVRDAVLLALPLAPLCRPDCAGPAPGEFPTGDPAAQRAEPDPRWAALDDLRFD